MEAIIFGLLAYFGAEIGEFAHKQYDKYLLCEVEECETVEEPNKEFYIPEKK